MAQQQPLAAASPAAFPVFIDTNLDTHLAVVVSPDDTVRDVHRKVIMEHACGFPEMGDITILAIKVRRRSALYRLSESMKVKDAFVGIKGSRFLHVDVNRAINAKSLVAVPSIDALSEKVEHLKKSCMVEMDTGVNNASVTEQCRVNEVVENDQNLRPIDPFDPKPSASGDTSAAQKAKEKVPVPMLQSPEFDVHIPVDFNRSEEANISVGVPGHLLEHREERRDDPCTGEHVLVRSDFQVKSDRMGSQEENSTQDKRYENPLFKEMEEGTEILPMLSGQHRKRTMDFDGNSHVENLEMLPTDKKKRKKMKGKVAENHGSILVGVAGMESNELASKLQNKPEKTPNSIDGEGNDEDPVREFSNQVGPTTEKKERNDKKRRNKMKGKRSVEESGLAHLEEVGAVSIRHEPLSETLLEIEPEHNDPQTKFEGSANELGDNPRDSYEATKSVDENILDKMRSEKKARKKSKRKRSVENIQSEVVEAEPNEIVADLENTPEKGHLQVGSENTNEGGVVELVDQSLNDPQTKFEGSANELGDNPRDSYEATKSVDENILDKIRSEKKARKKSKRKGSVETIQAEVVEAEPNEIVPDLENMPEKGHLQVASENTNEGGVVQLVDQSFNVSEKGDCLSPKNVSQRKKKKKGHQLSDESLAKVDENTCLETCLFPTEERFNPMGCSMDPLPYKEENVIAVMERNIEENCSGKKSNVTDPEAPNAKVKKSRHKKNSTSVKEQMVASLAANENAPNVDIRVIDGHIECSIGCVNDFVENVDVAVNTGESAKNLAVGFTEVDLSGASSVQKSNLEKRSTDFISESSLDSQNKNTNGSLTDRHAEPANINKSLEKNAERTDIDYSEELILGKAGEMLPGIGSKVLPDANISKLRMKQKKNEKLRHLSSKTENNHSFEEHPSSGHDGGHAIDLPHDEISPNPIFDNPVHMNSVKSQSCNQEKLRTSKKKLPKITEPSNIEMVRPGTSLLELQASGDGQSGADGLQTDLPQKATGEEDRKKLVDNVSATKLRSEALLTINGKESVQHKRKSAKNNLSNQRYVNVEETLDADNMVSSKKDKDADAHESTLNSAPDFTSNATYKSSDSNGNHGSEQCIGTECPGNSNCHGERSDEINLQRKVPTSEPAKDGGLQYSVSPRLEVGKSDFMDIFLPNRGHQGHVTPEEGMAKKEADAGKVQKVKSKGTGTNKTLVRPQNFSPGSDSIPSPHDSRRPKKIEGSFPQGYVDKDYLEEHNTVTRGGGDVMEKMQGNDLLLDKRSGENKSVDTGKPPSKIVDTCLDVVQPGSRINSMASKAIDHPVASSASTEENSPKITRRFRVAVRKVPRSGLRSSNISSDKRNLSVKDNIFDDDSSSSTNGSLNKNDQKSALKGSDIGYSTSSDSDGDFDGTQSSQALPSKVIDFRGNTRMKGGNYGIKAHIPDSDGGKLNLSAILKNSSTYKRAKVLASKGQDEEKPESQPVDIVPETQPEDIVAS